MWRPAKELPGLYEQPVGEPVSEHDEPAALLLVRLSQAVPRQPEPSPFRPGQAPGRVEKWKEKFLFFLGKYVKIAIMFAKLSRLWDKRQISECVE